MTDTFTQTLDQIDKPVEKQSTTNHSKSAHIDTKDTKKSNVKSKNKLGCLLVFIILSVCCLTTAVVAGIIYLRKNHVPMISPYVENLYMSDGEQFASRMSLYADFAAYTLANDDDKLIKTDIQKSDINPLVLNNIAKATERLKYSKSSMDMTLEVQIASDLQSLLSEQDLASDLKLTLNTTSEGDTTVPISGGQITAQFINGDQTYSAEIELKNNQQGMYFNIKEFPQNPYLDMTTILDKWIYVKTDQSSGLEDNPALGLLSQYGSYQDAPELKINKSDLQNLKKLLFSKAFTQTVESAGSEKIDNIKTKCYKMTLTDQAMADIYNEIQIIWNTGKKAQTKEDYKGLDQLVLTICFGLNDALPYKMTMDIGSSADGSSLKLSLEYKYSPLSSAPQIDIPTDYLKQEDVDWQSMLTFYQTIPTPPTSDLIYDADSICQFYPDSPACSACKKDENNVTCLKCNQLLSDLFTAQDPTTFDQKEFNSCFVK